ncbi:MAG: class IV adenylate cyclase [Candidatus Pacebacteria bacterium]|nr:class IV adenylate cyclase [Candidatus Paceibacterota bacterium]
MQKEIEVKIQVSDLKPIQEKLESLGCVISNPIAQHDTIFNLNGITINDHKTPVLRIREQNGKYIFTFKQDVTNELDCIEHETEITNKDELVKIIERLNFVKTVEVRKTRRKTQYGEYEICLDDVDNLGLFVEAQKMSEQDGKIVQDELIDFLVELGVPREGVVSRGYDTLVFEKLHQKESL